jgi:hypothetical protein
VIERFPFVILLPGIVFIAIGCYYLRRSAGAIEGTTFERQMKLAKRQAGILTIGFGVLLVPIGIPLMIAITQLNS